MIHALAALTKFKRAQTPDARRQTSTWHPAIAATPSFTLDSFAPPPAPAESGTRDSRAGPSTLLHAKQDAESHALPSLRFRASRPGGRCATTNGGRGRALELWGGTLWAGESLNIHRSKPARRGVGSARSSLAALGFDENQGGMECGPLAAALERFQSAGLKRLSLCFNELGDSGAVTLPLPTALEHLELGWNSMGDGVVFERTWGWACTAHAAAATQRIRCVRHDVCGRDVEHQGLTHLDLRGNRILSCGATVLAVLLTKLQQLLVLNLEATDLGLGGEPTMMGRGEHA